RIGTHVKPTEPQDIEFHRVIVQPEKAIKTVIPSSSIEPIHTATDELIDEKHTIVDSDLKAAAIQPCGEMQSTPLRPEPSMHAKEENFSLESAGTELYVFPTIEIIPEPIESPEILIHGKKGRDEQQILTSAAPLAINIERTWIEEGIARIGTDVKPTEPQDIEFHRVIVQPEKAIKTIIPSSSIEPIHTATDELIDEKHTIVDSDLKAAATQSFGEMHDASVELEYATHSRETNSILEGVDTKKLAFPNTEDLLEEVGSGLEATIHSEDTYVLQAVAGQVSSLRKSTLMTNPDESAQSLNIILSNTSLEPMDAIAIAPVIDIQQPGSLDTSASLIAPEPADYEGSIQTEEGRELQPVSEQTHVLTEAIHLTESHISPLSAEPNTPVEAASHIEKLSEEPEKDITKSKIEKFINALSTLNSSLGNLIQKISSLDPIESNPKSGNPLFIISFCLNLINTLLDKTSITLEITDLNKSTYSEQNEGTFLTQLETLKEKLDHFISLFGTVDRQKLNVETLERMRKATNLSLHISPKVLEFNVEDYLSRMERLGKLTTGVLSPEAQSNALAQTPVEAATSVSATLFQDSDGAPPKEIESETPTSHIKQPIAIQKIDSIKDNVETFMNELSTLNAGLNSFIQKVASLSPIEANPTLISPFYVINFTLNLINASLNEINKNLGIQILKEENGLDQKEETYLGALEIFRQKMAQFISDFNAVDQLRLDTTILKEMKKIKSLSSYVSSKLLEFKIEEYLSKKPQLIENVSKTKEIVLKTSAAELLSTTERLENILDNFVFKDEDFYKLDTYIQKSIPFILSQIFFFKNTLTYIQRKDNSLLKTYLRETKEDKLRYETLQAEGATLQIKLGAFRSGLDLLRQRLSNFKDVLEDFDFSHLDIIAICNLNSLRSTIEYLVTMVTSIKEKLGTSSASPVWPAAPVVALQEWLNKKVISTTSHNADDDQARTLPPNSVEEAISNTLDSASVPRSDVIPSTIEGEATTVITPPAAAQEPEADPGSVRGEGRVDGDDVVPLLSDLSVSSSPPLTGESEKTRLSPLHDEGIVSSSEHTFSSRKHIELEPLVGQQDDKIQAQEKARRLLEKMINLAMSPSLVTPVSDAGVEELTQLAFFSGDLRQLMDNALEQDEMPTTLIERAPSLEYAAFRPEMKILTQKLVALLKNYSFAKNRRCSLSTKLCYMSYLSNLTTIQLRLEAHPTINHDPFMLQEDELPISDKNLPKKKSSFLPISSTSLLTEGMLAKVGTPAAPNDEGAENRENGRLNPSFLPLRASGKGTDIMPKVFTHQSHPQGRLPRTPLGAFKPNTGPK
ncbi:MAG: hypothetical protein K2P93_09050, partial [Alphaproteobacteria bacterium]|nr:hypothetical protein [Alphaproteobacteria bacterium]